MQSCVNLTLPEPRAPEEPVWVFRVSRVGKAVYPCDAVGLGPQHRIRARERMHGRPSAPIRWPRQSSKAAYGQRSLPTLRDRADFPSCGVVLGAPAPRPVGPPRSRRSSRLPADLVASLLGHYPTSSAPPCLRGNLPRSRPREILRQAPEVDRKSVV